MKPTGVIRRIDELGRIVVPRELRTTLHLNDRDPMEIFVDGDLIIIKKYEPACIFTGESEDLIDYNGRKVSKKVIKEMAEKAGLTLAPPKKGPCTVKIFPTKQGNTDDL